MTTPHDPDQPGYGLPSFPSAPPPSEGMGGQQSFPPPNEITASFWCYVAAAVINLIGGFLVLGQRQTLIDQLRTANTSGLTDAQLNAVATTTLTVVLVIWIIVAALYVFFAFKLRQGRNWARVVLTVVAALALLALLFSGGNNSILSFIGELAAVAACVLSYFPNSNQYIAAIRNSRLGLR